MLGFRYVCQYHQRLFIEAIQRAADLDLDEMRQVRTRLLAWLSRHCPAMVLDHFNRKSCLGCALDACCIDLDAMYEAIRLWVVAAKGEPDGCAMCGVSRFAVDRTDERSAFLRDNPD